MVGDIRKMFNSIAISEMDQHCHRFLWRDMNTMEKPKSYVITRVNMGDKPAPAICAEAIQKTATMFQKSYLEVNRLLNQSIYVDDIVDSVESMSHALNLAKDTEHVLLKGGFQAKG